MFALMHIDQLEKLYRGYRQRLMEARALNGDRAAASDVTGEKTIAAVIVEKEGHSKLFAIRQSVDSDVLSRRDNDEGGNSLLVSILNECSPTSLNISKMPDGSFRVTAYDTTRKDWVKRTGASPFMALRETLKGLKE